MRKDRITKGVSFPSEEILNAAKGRSEQLGLRSFSEYVNQLIRKDNGLPNIFDSELPAPRSAAAEFPAQYNAQHPAQYNAPPPGTVKPNGDVPIAE